MPDEGLYRTVRLIRRFEERALELVKAGEIGSGIHPCIGQEGVATGVCAALEPGDRILSSHRGHGHLLAKGTDPRRLMAEMAGRSTGIDSGRGGSFHPSDPGAGVVGATGTVGHSAAIAAGVAWALAKSGTDRVVACFFGDGAVSQGALLEGLNLASLWRLPVLYVCENNGYATTLPVDAAVAGTILGRGEAFGIPSTTVDGQDPRTVLAATATAVARARAGGGPSLIEAKTYRYYGHHTFESSVRLHYRDEAEVAAWKQRDPLDIQGARVSPVDRARIDAEVERVLDDVVAFTLASPRPEPADALEFHYASGPGEQGGGLMPKLSYLKALNRALGDEMARDPGVFLLGEDVNQALTNTTHGLLDRFGPDRIVETPLSEQGFTNFATGAAMAGMRPVVEFQIPFLLLLVFEQIANQAAKFRQMSGGRVSVPVTYLLPSAGWRPEWGGQHSDQPYGLFAHMGVKTVVPATPTDAYGLLVTAIRDDDPVVFFAPIAALGVREDVDYADLVPVPLGVGLVRRSGTDVTVVAVGHLVHDALAVADELAGEASVEVFDPRTVYPFDWAGLAESVRRTGRLVVVDDANRSCGLAAEILATAAEELPLVAPPVRVTRPDGAILGALPQLDLALQPSREQLAVAVQRVLKSG